MPPSSGWKSFRYSDSGTFYEHQAAYNKAFAVEFKRFGWEPRPVLHTNPKLIGDFRKGLVFVEIQFGNSAALYRDYHKFQYGLANGLLSLAVLIVPTTAKAFFPARPDSVQNMQSTRWPIRASRYSRSTSRLYSWDYCLNLEKFKIFSYGGKLC